MAVALKIGSWLCAIFMIFSAIVWLVGGFLVTNALSNNAGGTVPGLDLIPATFWPFRAVVSAIGVVGAVTLVLSRRTFFRVIALWLALELILIGWLYASGFLASQFNNLESVRNLAILQMCGLSVVIFSWVKHNTLFRSGILQE
ncbi:hypothetical protein SAMN04515647_0837 [Cohaesibacter sp. ES.047]|uniref:hypothetical protein n=1 Tax=Cohaesibacter sp. ES.047 TaxID=1798205 RepID=UPI000BC0A38F|nr:hypothetical protein [Cohaesibacter sp. ES.047]SNY90666.1 hypothetical protein SAMN04515647_0837 [Cohaesibacter sp. ES.047]